MDIQRKNKVTCILFALIFAAGFLLCIFLPKKEYSDYERRRLAPMPICSLQQVWSGRFMADFESHAVDTFPFRDQLRMLKAMTSANVFARQDNNGIYISDGYISSMEYPLDEQSVNEALGKFRHVCETYLTKENQVFLSVIPDKNCFLAQEGGHPMMDYEALEFQIEQKADFAEYIRISDLLQKEDYYKTDTHWRQEQITDVAARLAEGMGTALCQDYDIHTIEEDFYGVYYGQAALPLAPDRLQYLTGEAIDSCSVYDWQNQRKISIYNMEAVEGKDPYEMFLYGSLSLITIENINRKTDRRLVLFRDSFGSSIAPLLISGYEQITLVDIRYISPKLLGKFVDFENCDVLFLYSTLVLNHSETIL